MWFQWSPVSGVMDDRERPLRHVGSPTPQGEQWQCRGAPIMRNGLPSFLQQCLCSRLLIIKQWDALWQKLFYNCLSGFNDVMWCDRYDKAGLYCTLTWDHYRLETINWDAQFPKKKHSNKRVWAGYNSAKSFQKVDLDWRLICELRRDWPQNRSQIVTPHDLCLCLHKQRLLFFVPPAGRFDPPLPTWQVKNVVCFFSFFLLV